MDHTRTTLSQRYATVVGELMGLPLDIDEDGTLRFEHEGAVYFLDNYAPSDPEYFRLHHGLRLDEATLALDLNAAAAEATGRTKGAKVVVRDGCVIASVEFLVAAPDCLPSVQTLAGILPRAIRMVKHGLYTFSTGVTLAGIESASAASTAEAVDQ